MTAVLQNVLESRFSTATTHDQKVLEAARLFSEGINGRSHTARAVLTEAFTTSDFPVLLGDAFEREARATYQGVTDETALIAPVESVRDFRGKKLNDIFAADYFEQVGEGEEYKSTNPFQETEIDLRPIKYGRNFGLTWELLLAGDFDRLVQFPTILGNGAADTRNRVIYERIVDGGQLNGDYFSETGTAALSYQALRDAKAHLAQQVNQHDDPIDLSQLVLIVPPALEDEAVAITSARNISRVHDDGAGNVTELEQSNPLAGIQVQVSREFGKLLDSGLRHSAWALVPGARTENPTLARVTLAGHPDVDIRVKRDQGERVGGGQVGYQEGSFDNDTVWYRGRSVTGSAIAFNHGAYGSTGAA
jgi:hypothetical protein